MKKRDYMISYGENEMMVDNLKEARKEAKRLSKEYGEARIEKWDMIDNDMVIDDYFMITYKDGKEVK